MVKVKISYPKDFKGPKFYKEGDTPDVSEESAEHFVKLGIGKILDSDDDSEKTPADQTGTSEEATAGSSGANTGVADTKATKK